MIPSTETLPSDRCRICGGNLIGLPDTAETCSSQCHMELLLDEDTYDL